MADEIDFDEMERYEAELRDEIRDLAEQNKLLENELVAVSAERDMWKEKAVLARIDGIEEAETKAAELSEMLRDRSGDIRHFVPWKEWFAATSARIRKLKEGER